MEALPYALFTVAILIAAALAEAIRQQHVIAIPLTTFLLAIGGLYLCLNKRQAVSTQPTMPALVRLKPVKEPSEFAHVALPNSVIYVTPRDS